MKNYPPYNALEDDSKVAGTVTLKSNETGRGYEYSMTQSIDVYEYLARWPWLKLPRGSATFTGLRPGGYHAIEVYNKSGGLMHRMCLRLPLDPNG